MESKARKPLTALEISRLTKPGRYSDGSNRTGLYLLVKASGAKSWVLRYRFGGKQHDVGLGSIKDVGLSQARQKARDMRGQLCNKINPLQAKQEKEDAQRLKELNRLTFAKAAQAYIEAHAPAWRNVKHKAQWESTLETYAGPVIGALPVDSVTTELVQRILEPIWHTKTETATRLRGRIESVLDWACVRGYRQGENPARWKGHLDKLLPAPSKVKNAQHHDALPYAEIGPFMQELKQREGFAVQALQFLIYTAARSGEVRGAVWSEIDLNAGLWTIPAERMKAQREHRVPLSAPALALLRGLPRLVGTELVFPAPRGGQLSDMTMTAIMRRWHASKGGTDKAPTVHGFRSSFRDWAAERTDYQRELAEQALSHALTNKVEAAYRRSDLLEKRRTMMQAWAEHCSTVALAGTVIAINSKAA